MLKAMIEKIVELSAPSVFNFDGENYSSKPLNYIKPVKHFPEQITVNGLDSICKLVRDEQGLIGKKVFIQVPAYDKVSVFSTYDEDFERAEMYKCFAETPKASIIGRFISYEYAAIELRTMFIPNADSEYLLHLLGSISTESKVTSSDNGVTQTVEAKTGIALKETVNIKPRVTLQPFRTFLEVPQPESEFVLRVNGDGKIALFEADGGVWKLEATRNIAAYFEEALKDEIKKGLVAVIR